MVIERNKFSDYFNEIVRECKVMSVGFQAKNSLHSFRGTLIYKLQEMGHTNSQMVKRMGHKSINSLH